MDCNQIINSIGLFVQIVVAIAVVFGVRQITINQKQLHLNTITKCINDFRNLSPFNINTDNEKVLSIYIDLTNEELFYFQHEYIPKEVAKEWLDGMIDFIPITDKSHRILNGRFCNQSISQNRNKYFNSYPRVKNAFSVKSNFDFELIYSNDESKSRSRIRERRKLIKEILFNIKKFDEYN